MSARQAGLSAMASSSRLALLSADDISHHQLSVRSVEKPMVVPCRFRRARRICSAWARCLACCGSWGERFSTRYQSITADVGHRLGATVNDSRSSWLMALLRESASSAATLRTARSAVGSGDSSHSLPCTKACKPDSMRALSSAGIS